MKQYYVGLTRTYQIILVLVFAPLIGVPVLLVGALYGPTMPGWAALAIIYGFIAVGIILAFLLTKAAQHKAVVTMREDGFSVDFESPNFLTPAPFELRMKQVDELNLKQVQGMCYMQVKATVAPYSFNLEGRNKGEEEQAEFLRMAGVVLEMFENKKNAK